ETSRPKMNEAWPISPPTRFWTRLGRIGITRPMPRTSMNSVIRTKTMLAFRLRIQALRGAFGLRLTQLGADEDQSGDLDGGQVDLRSAEAELGVDALQGADSGGFVARHGLALLQGRNRLVGM